MNGHERKPNPVTTEDWLDAYMDYLADESAGMPNLADLDPRDRGDAKRQAHLTSELWGRQAAPRTEGSSTVAAFLGFDQIDSNVSISGPALKAARRSAGQTVSELARQLAALGWAVSAAEIGELETGKRLEVPGASVPLLVALLGISAIDLVVDDDAPVDALLRMEQVQAAVAAAAIRLGRTIDEVVSALRPQLASAQFRERDRQEGELVEIVEALLDGME